MSVRYGSPFWMCFPHPSQGTAEIPVFRTLRDVLSNVEGRCTVGINTTYLVSSEVPDASLVSEEVALPRLTHESMRVDAPAPASFNAHIVARYSRESLKPLSRDRKTAIGARSGVTPGSVKGESCEPAPLPLLQPFTKCRTESGILMSRAHSTTLLG